jgi:phosphoribosylformimino-5-aminoimidazole carboxamide ribotide isomerase
MIIIPAIDIKDGKVVRLTRGDFLAVRIYSDDPAAMAKEWQNAGASLLHVVDLDGARTGELKNLACVENIVSSVTIPVEVGGGIRDEKAIATVLDKGVAHVVLGTRALDEKFITEMVATYRDRLIVSIDAKDGVVAVKGWQHSGDVDAVAFARHLESVGVKRIIYTDVLKDGTLKGPNFFSIEKLLDAVGMEVIASGGVSCLDDLKKLKLYEHKGLTGVIVGKALYEKRIDLQEALAALC